MNDRRRPGTPAVERVWARLPAGARAVLEDELAPTDLQTLLLSLTRTRAHQVGLPRLRRRWLQDRFVRPSGTDPRRLAATAAHLWRMLPADFDGLALSPVTPLGTCAAVGAADQNRVLSTVRSSEVVSDPTNVLALEAAARRRGGADAVHLAACHRALRNQRFDAPEAAAHFELFTLVSSARDSGAGRTEAKLLVRHLRFWAEVTVALLGAQVGRIDLTLIDDVPVRERLDDTVRPALGGVRLADAPERTQGIGYYRSAAFKIMADGDTAEIELGDGGFTGWTAALMADAKERCLVSCISTERLTQLMDGDD
jgi:hypothetical protein